MIHILLVLDELWYCNLFVMTMILYILYNNCKLTHRRPRGTDLSVRSGNTLIYSGHIDTAETLIDVLKVPVDLIMTIMTH